MKNKKRNFTSWIPIFFIGLLLVSAGTALGYFLPHKNVTTISANDSSKVSDSDYVGAVKKLIESRYYKAVDDKSLVNGSIKGMLNSLDDPYTTYLDKKESQALNDTISSSIVGIGVTIMVKDKQITVDSVLDDTPAKKAGIKAKDVIIKVNDKSVVGKSATEVTKLVRGKKGTSVSLTVRRDQQNLSFKMDRDTIPIKTVKSKMLGNGVGYLSVSTFSEPTTKEFKEAISSLRKSGAKKFVVDMRGNPGGEMTQALSMSSMFLKDGQKIMQVQGREKSDLTVYTASKKLDDGFKINEPTVVLVDQDSASAAEIFTAALKESGKKVVGVKSFGKGTVQTVVQLADDAELKMTIAKWLTPNGTWINHKGITPNYVVNYPSYTNIVMSNVKKDLKEGDVSSNIKSVQEGLEALGYQPGNTKGIFDQQTVQAVKDFQTKSKISVSGVIDNSTINQLVISLSEKAQSDDPMKKKAVELLQQ